MQQTAGFYITNIPTNQFDTVVKEINRYFDQLESKPLYFEEWRTGLCLFKNQGGIRMLSDVHADYFEYEIILPGLIEHLAENVPNTPMNGDYNLSNDDFGDEYHKFEITTTGQLIWNEDDNDFDDEIDDDLFFEAVDMAYGESTTNALYNGVFSLLSASDIKTAFDICAAIHFEGAPIEAVYEELRIDNNTPKLADLIDIISQCNDSIGCPTMYAYISYLIEKFSEEDIDIEFPEELQDAINELL